MMIEERECATRWRSNDLETRVFPTSETRGGGGHGSNSQQRRRTRAWYWYPEVRFSQKYFDVVTA